MIKGITVSKWQGEMDWYKARNTGARFGFIRAGSITDWGGILYPDDQFERNADLAPDYMPVGFFWYFRPDHDAIKQADYFCDLIRSKKRGKYGQLPPVLDLEESGGLSPFTATQAAKSFCLQVFHRLLVWPLLYSRAIWLNANTIADSFWQNLELWIARYTSKLEPWGNPGDSKDLCPRDFSTWRFWQVSADGNGLGGEYGAKSDSICIEVFNGDEAAFCLYTAGSPANLVRVKVPIAGLRSGQGGARIGNTWYGRAWPVLGKSEDGEWTRVEGWIRSGDVEPC
jgi:GH25 family lysozyme M1 (1,4-beta-N-acetylmuramidase)